MIQTAQTALGSFRVDEVNDVDLLASYRLQWGAFLARTRGATFFQSLDWLEAYWRHFGEEQQLRALVVFARGKPIGILPLAVRRQPTPIGALRVLGYPAADWGVFYGPVGSDATATLLAGLRHIRNTRRNWDLLDIRPVDTGGVDRGRTRQAMRMAGFSFSEQPWASTAKMEVDGEWETYWMGRREKWRHSVARCEARLRGAGRLSYVRFRPRGTAHGDGDPQWDLYDACQQIARRSRAARLGRRATRDEDPDRPFLRDAHEAAAHTGCADLNLLMLDDEPIAFLYGYQSDGRVYALESGCDPDRARLAPDAVLQYRALEDSFRRGDRVVNWAAASTRCHRHWQTSVATSFRYVHYPLRAPRTQLLRVKHWLDRRLSRVPSQAPSAM